MSAVPWEDDSYQVTGDTVNGNFSCSDVTGYSGRSGPRVKEGNGEVNEVRVVGLCVTRVLWSVPRKNLVIVHEKVLEPSTERISWSLEQGSEEMLEGNFLDRVGSGGIGWIDFNVGRIGSVSLRDERWEEVKQEIV